MTTRQPFRTMSFTVCAWASDGPQEFQPRPSARPRTKNRGISAASDLTKYRDRYGSASRPGTSKGWSAPTRSVM